MDGGSAWFAFLLFSSGKGGGGLLHSIGVLVGSALH